MKPDCEPCKMFEKKLRKVVNSIIKQYGDILRFGKINGELNDIEKVSILNYPAINLYQKESKAKPVKYEINDFEISNLLKFITENYEGKIDYDTIIQLIGSNEENINKENVELKCIFIIKYFMVIFYFRK